MKTTRVTFICRPLLYVTQLYAVYVFWWRPFFANHIWYLLLIIATSYFPICHRASCWDAQTWHLLYLVITSMSIVKVIMLQCCSSAANASLYIWKVCPILPCNKTCLIKCIMTDHWQQICRSWFFFTLYYDECIRGYVQSRTKFTSLSLKHNHGTLETN